MALTTARPRRNGATGRSPLLAGALAGGAVLGFAAAASGLSVTSAQQALKLGLSYDLGANGPSDPVRARIAYAIAASAGLPEAEFNLGVLYDSGVGTRIDRATAALWYARAATHGFGRAAFDLGELFELGDGVPRNPALAADWFKVAEAGGIPAAYGRAASVAGAAPRTGDIAPPNLAPAQVDASTPGTSVPVELVWTETAMPLDARFFVEIVPDGSNPARDLVWQPVEASGLLVHVPADPASYRWRVLVASGATGHYVSSDWSRFRVGPA